MRRINWGIHDEMDTPWHALDQNGFQVGRLVYFR